MKVFYRRFTVYLYLALSFPIIVYVQPSPCLEAIPEMTPLCADACIICDIDGFTGRHQSSVVGEAPSDFCTFFVHNAQWIAFLAGSEELSVNLSVSNCAQGAGLEVAIYESLDCENFNLVSNCLGGMNSPVANGQTRTITVNEPLTVGQYYYLVMDGAFGDNCDWTFEVVSGDTQVDPLNSSGMISGDFAPCPGITTTYQTEPQLGATIYEWTLNGAPLASDDTTVMIDWTANGDYEVCVTASNVCDAAPPSCRTISVSSISPLIIDEVLCATDCLQLNDTLQLCEAGSYEFNFLTANGCDSTVLVQLELVEASTTDLIVAICEGDSLFVGSTPYFQPGQFSTVLENYLGCDSTVNLELATIICEIQGSIQEEPVACFGENSGALIFQVDDGTPPFTYGWEQLGGTLLDIGNIVSTNTPERLENLPPGTYVVEITDNFGNDVVLIQEITEPPPLVITLEETDYNGFSVSCAGSNDGTLQALPMGGVAPYSYAWNTGAEGVVINDLTVGEYVVTVTDSYGCRQVSDAILTAPTMLEVQVDFNNPSCDGFDTGSVSTVATSGGVSPYLYRITGGDFSPLSSFINLTEGSYNLTVQDANGCEIDTTASLIAPLIPEIDLGEDQRINLGESIVLRANSNIALDTVTWSGSDGLSCYDCPAPEARPFSDSQYILSVTSSDGCTTVDSINIQVQKRRRVYAPNVFSPNRDGVNDRFGLFGGIEVQVIRQLTVYDRWGSSVFSAVDLAVNSPQAGWDGTRNGDAIQPGVYVWVADVELLDGEVFQLQGDVLVLL